MNWYKQTKYAWNWKKFLIPSLFPLIPFFIALQFTPEKAKQFSDERNNNPAIIQNDLAKIKQDPISNQKENTIEIKQPTEHAEIKQNNQIDINYIKDIISQHEGKRYRAYNDGKGFATIGIGHLLIPTDNKLFGNLFGPYYETNFKKILNGSIKLTEEQVEKLFIYDLQKHLDIAKRLFPKLETYPNYIQAALISSIYRGDMGKKTRDLINADKWDEAAKEYLNHNEYKTTKLRGVVSRMNENQAAMFRYHKETNN
ncbi:MAG: hypothetical protein WDA06_02830 [Phenylobacterium sp.]